MNGSQMLDAIFAKLSSEEQKLQTKNGLWFTAYVKKGKLYINGASECYPVCDIKRPRPIPEKEFMEVFSCYDHWANGKTGIRQIIRQKSMNAAYIFAIIEFAK